MAIQKCISLVAFSSSKWEHGGATINMSKIVAIGCTGQRKNESVLEMVHQLYSHCNSIYILHNNYFQDQMPQT